MSADHVVKKKKTSHIMILSHSKSLQGKLLQVEQGGDIDSADRGRAIGREVNSGARKKEDHGGDKGVEEGVAGGLYVCGATR